MNHLFALPLPLRRPRRCLPGALLALLLLGCGGVEPAGLDDDPVVRTTTAFQQAMLNVPFFSQQPNVQACSAANLAMALKYNGVDRLADGVDKATNSKNVYQWFVSHGYVDSIGRVISDRLTEAASSLSADQVNGTVVDWSGDSLQSVRDALLADEPVMLFALHNKLPGSGISTSTAHSILCYGFKGDRFYYLNPFKSTAKEADFSITEPELSAALLGKVLIRYGQPGNCHSGKIFGWNYCSDDCPCAENEGDCDRDSQCQPGLICALNRGAEFGAPSWVDICLPPGAE